MTTLKALRANLARLTERQVRSRLTRIAAIAKEYERERHGPDSVQWSPHDYLSDILATLEK